LTATSASRAYTLHADERQWFFTSYVYDAAPWVVATGASACEYCNTVGGGDLEAAIPGDPSCWCAVMDTQNPATGTNATTSSGIFGIALKTVVTGNAVSTVTTFRLSRDSSLLPNPVNCGNLCLSGYTADTTV